MIELKVRKKMAESTFTHLVKQIIKQIPYGKVATYGQIAGLAGNYRAARQVVRVLHTSSTKDGLPWHRVINKQGKISLPMGHGYEQQKMLLQAEGVEFDGADHIDFTHFLWQPET
jgi:methylated-DNA-protein-cysteine methyltransferase-like protein